MHRYIPNTDSDKLEMLKSMGFENIEDLFSDIPKGIRFDRDLDLSSSLSELEVTNFMTKLSKMNKSTDDLVCFLGAGAYDHYIPSIVKHLGLRSEFLTAYTPYQPEISQGTLQSIFEYQTLICNLTGMDVTNASMYDGNTACAEASLIAVENARRDVILISKSVHPEIREVVKSYMNVRDVKVIEVDIKDGVTDVDSLSSLLDKNVAGVIVESPNFFGIIEDLAPIEKIVHSNKSMLIQYADPISLSILKSPREWNADIAVGEAQCLGNDLNFGGPYLGYLATTSKHARKMPGRIVGQTEDVDGKRGFVLTLQAREQHIRRYKATSNICSNEGVVALMAAIYMVTLGKKGMKEVAEQCLQKSHYAMKELTKNNKYSLTFDKPFFKEFAVTAQVSAEKVNEELLNKGYLGGYLLEKDYKDLKNSILLCVTEKRTKEEIDSLVNIMEVIS
ncbi:MAG: aminomethyl-transferring glycine dehydrogenase subunit GcvPA [Oscillospiraceae bacterium]|nr:aminomethyl-transferring glycine dehydrogenase subunit GcvPA [Oscillospiraceae bacterium]